MIALKKEATKVVQFIDQKVKSHKTILYEKMTVQGQEKAKTFAVRYVKGIDIHEKIILNSEAILKLCPTIQKLQDVELHGLERVEDSVRLCLILMQIGVLRRVIPSKLMYPNPNAKEAEKPKQVDMAPQQGVSQTGLYIFVMEQSAAKMNFYLVLVVFGLVFFMLYRVWPVWLKLWVYYFSYYTLCFLIGAGIVRAIVWFLLFHVGLDFWIFPNYFIDSNNPLDTLWPLLDVKLRDDKFDTFMGLVRLVSAFLIFQTGSEFMKDPKNWEDVSVAGSEIMTELYEWGHDKFMGVPQNTTQVQLKKSARQIYAEAFMEDDSLLMGGGNRRMYQYDDVQEPGEEKTPDSEETQQEVDLDADQEAEKEPKIISLDDLLGGDDEEEDPATSDL